MKRKQERKCTAKHQPHGFNSISSRNQYKKLS